MNQAQWTLSLHRYSAHCRPPNKGHYFICFKNKSTHSNMFIMIWSWSERKLSSLSWRGWGVRHTPLTADWKTEWQTKQLFFSLFVSTVITTVATTLPFISSVTSHGKMQSVAQIPLCNICHASALPRGPAGNSWSRAEVCHISHTYTYTLFNVIK